MIDWKSKLSSRKFWAALIGFISALMFAFNYAEADVEKVAGIITAGSTLIVYILAEAHVDANRVVEYIELVDNDEALD